jgi:hypothetical protein
MAAVFPEAKFIHLIRDGSDVVESIHRQSLTPPDWKYILGKALSFPRTQAFGYGLSYAADTIRKTMSGDRVKKGSWGPRYQGIEFRN